MVTETAPEQERPAPEAQAPAPPQGEGGENMDLNGCLPLGNQPAGVVHF